MAQAHVGIAVDLAHLLLLPPHICCHLPPWLFHRLGMVYSACEVFVPILDVLVGQRKPPACFLRSRTHRNRTYFRVFADTVISGRGGRHLTRKKCIEHCDPWKTCISEALLVSTGCGGEKSPPPPSPSPFLWHCLSSVCYEVVGICQ